MEQRENKAGTGLRSTTLITNFLHRKNVSQFRQKMNVYGLVRPGNDRPIGSGCLMGSANERADL